MTLEDLMKWAATVEARLQNYAAILAAAGHDVFVDLESSGEAIVTPAIRPDPPVETPAPVVEAHAPVEAAQPAEAPAPPVDPQPVVIPTTIAQPQPGSAVVDTATGQPA